MQNKKRQKCLFFDNGHLEKMISIEKGIIMSKLAYFTEMRARRMVGRSFCQDEMRSPLDGGTKSIGEF